ncbi:PD40 domain-containing protein [bacterium AH-315-C07]|nr:PD40 domain-containing protein [bacterium AH-315-C07]
MKTKAALRTTSLFFILLLFISSVSHAVRQDEKDIKSLISEGNHFYENELYTQALPIYKKLKEKKSDDPEISLRLGVCQLNSNAEKSAALENLKMAAEQEGISPEVFYWLGRAYHFIYEFDLAIENYNKFISAIPEEGNEDFIADTQLQIEMCNNGKELLKNPVDVKIENLGPTINSKYPDYVPLISTDESMLIFTSRREGASNGKIYQVDGFPFEDVYVSTRIDTTWTKPVNIGSPINTDKHDATVGLSADGQKLMIYRDGDIYVCDLEGDKWTEPYPIADDVNTSAWEPSASLSADGYIFYFSSDRKGGHGGRDIWRVKRLPTGEWSKAQNCGSVINTPLNEDSPFIHPDGKTLFFSSNGHYSMGGFDIYKSKMDESGQWGPPENLGYPVNTSDDDIYFVLSGDGIHGYYSSIRPDGYGEKDLYMITFPGEKYPITVMRGVVADIDGNPMGGKIVVTDNETGEIVGIFKANSVTGKYIVILPPGRNYNFRVEGNDGYVFYTKNVDIPEQSEFTIIEQTINIEEKRIGAQIALRNVFFDSDKTVLRPESKVELDMVAQFVQANPNLTFEILGHTDNTADAQHNQILSEKRALSVVEYLMEIGVSMNRITAKGYGEDQPVATNETEEGKQENRRVELRIAGITAELPDKRRKSSDKYKDNKGAFKPMKGISYMVQVGTSSEPISVKDKQFKGLDGIMIDDSDKKLLRYVVGGFITYSEAAEFRNKLKAENGFEDCFVVAYLGSKKITLGEAKNLSTKD